MRNLQNVDLIPSKFEHIGYFPLNSGNTKETVRGYMRQLAKELHDHSPVREILNTYTAYHREYIFGERENGVWKTGGQRAAEQGRYSHLPEEAEISALLAQEVASFTKPEQHQVNWFRRLMRAYKNGGQQGVVEYIFVLAKRFSLPKEGTSQFKTLTSEQIEEYMKIAKYFNSLILCVSKGMLPMRVKQQVDETK